MKHAEPSAEKSIELTFQSNALTVGCCMHFQSNGHDIHCESDRYTSDDVHPDQPPPKHPRHMCRPQLKSNCISMHHCNSFVLSLMPLYCMRPLENLDSKGVQLLVEEIGSGEAWFEV